MGNLSPLRHRLQTGAVLFIWLLASGAHWDAAQVFAWGTMFSRYAETMTLAQAARKTFSGEMCNLCKAVDSAKQEKPHSPFPPDPSKGKLVLACPTVHPLLFSPPQDARWTERESHCESIDRDAPPPPPPRGRFFIG